MWTSQFRMNFRILKEVFTMSHGDKEVTLEESLKMELSEVSGSIALLSGRLIHSTSLKRPLV